MEPGLTYIEKPATPTTCFKSLKVGDFFSSPKGGLNHVVSIPTEKGTRLEGVVIVPWDPSRGERGVRPVEAGVPGAWRPDAQVTLVHVKIEVTPC